MGSLVVSSDFPVLTRCQLLYFQDMNIGRTGYTEKNVTKSPGGIPVAVEVMPFSSTDAANDLAGLHLHLEYARLKLLRGFEELLCLEGLQGVEHFPHQIETVRKVLRHFRGRVLLADEVGLGKTIEACLLLREYLLRGLVKRVLILVPSSLVLQWREELSSKFSLDFCMPSSSASAGFWTQNNLVLASHSLAKSRKHFDAVTECLWDLVIVDEAHHCKNRNTRHWQVVNQLKRRHLFLLTATPVQNDLLELYNLLTLLEPGHLKTEKDFKKTYVRRGNPRNPLNRERLRSLLSEVMIRNTRSLVSSHLPTRYAQTFVVRPKDPESEIYPLLEDYLREKSPEIDTNIEREEDSGDTNDLFNQTISGDTPVAQTPPTLTRMQIQTLISASGSHPCALSASLEKMDGQNEQTRTILGLIGQIRRSAKEDKMLELLKQNPKEKILIFANFRTTLERLGRLLTEEGIEHSIFSGSHTLAEKQQAVLAFRDRMNVMLCSKTGGEGHNLQFANTLINFDLPWNPMRIEQRVGRLHRIGQTRDVFIFNLCTADSIEDRILRLLNDKIRMFELIVGEVGSILGNLEGGEEFESLVLNLWFNSRTSGDLDQAFEHLGDSLIDAQREYLQAKDLDEALFGEDYE
jgi:SNF2 family DNA or RNA helicase